MLSVILNQVEHAFWRNALTAGYVAIFIAHKVKKWKKNTRNWRNIYMSTHSWLRSTCRESWATKRGHSTALTNSSAEEHFRPRNIGKSLVSVQRESRPSGRSPLMYRHYILKPICICIAHFYKDASWAWNLQWQSRASWNKKQLFQAKYGCGTSQCLKKITSKKWDFEFRVVVNCV